MGPQGLEHDRRFMLCKVEGGSGELTKMQLSRFPQCGLFAQEIVGDQIHVRYLKPKDPLVPTRPEQDLVLEIPLRPDLEKLDRADVNLHQALVVAYRMNPRHDAWFSACFGFDTALVYIGDARRPVLGSFSPKTQRPTKSWFASITSYVAGSAAEEDEEDWITFTDCAPYLITTEQSLRNVSARLSEGDVEMYKFRPNIVLDGEEQWDEDFWAEITIGGDSNDRHVLTLTQNCNRCASLNVDYDTGQTALGERGTVLKKLMSDRRVDAGAKWSPVFGRYGFLTRSRQDAHAEGGDDDGAVVSVGDCVEVTRRNVEHSVFDWPVKDPQQARYYRRVPE